MKSSTPLKANTAPVKKKENHVDGIVHLDLLPDVGKTLVIMRYCRILQNVHQHRHGKKAGGILFYQDNARSQKIEQLRWELIAHLLYSPYLVPYFRM